MNTRLLKRLSMSALAAAIALHTLPAFAQHAGHAMPMPAAKPAASKPASKPAAKAVVRKPAPKAAARPATKPAAAAMTHSGMDHSAMGHAAPASKPVGKPVARPAAKPRPRPVATSRPVTPKSAAPSSAGAMDHAAMGHGPAVTAPTPVDHAAMGHAMPAVAPNSSAPATLDHASMDHGSMDHAGMGHDPAAMSSSPDVDHAAMGHGEMGHGAAAPGSVSEPGSMPGMDHASMGHGVDTDLPADAAPRTPIPVVTDAERAAAFAPLAYGHGVHDQRTGSYWLVDRLEWQDTEEGSLAWEGLAWVGGDINRLWLRTEGEASDDTVESAKAEALYGRSISTWWDAVAGVRHDFGLGPSRTYAAFGFQGLAPYKFEVEATAFVGAGGRGGLNLEAEYDTLITNRLILQWQAEANLYAKDDRPTGVGSGLSSIEAGARLRYELNRRFAPYIGVQFERSFGDTSAFRRAEGEPTRDTRLVAGIRFWF